MNRWRIFFFFLLPKQTISSYQQIIRWPGFDKPGCVENWQSVLTRGVNTVRHTDTHTAPSVTGVLVSFCPSTLSFDFNSSSCLSGTWWNPDGPCYTVCRVTVIRTAAPNKKQNKTQTFIPNPCGDISIALQCIWIHGYCRESQAMLTNY